MENKEIQPESNAVSMINDKEEILQYLYDLLDVAPPMHFSLLESVHAMCIGVLARTEPAESFDAEDLENLISIASTICSIDLQPSIDILSYMLIDLGTDDTADLIVRYVDRVVADRDKLKAWLTDHKKEPIAASAADRIRVLKANDVTCNPVLVADDMIMFDKVVNLFDLAMDATKINQSWIDYTALISGNVSLDTIYISISKDNGEDPTTVEVISIPVHFQFVPSQDIGDFTHRIGTIVGFIKIDETTSKADGTVNVTLAELTAGMCIIVNLEVSGEINLKSSNVSAQCKLNVVLGTVPDTTYTAEVTAAFNRLTFTPLAYSVDARCAK